MLEPKTALVGCLKSCSNLMSATSDHWWDYSKEKSLSPKTEASFIPTVCGPEAEEQLSHIGFYHIFFFFFFLQMFWSFFHQKQKMGGLPVLFPTAIAWYPRITCSLTVGKWKRSRSVPMVIYAVKMACLFKNILVLVTKPNLHPFILST